MTREARHPLRDAKVHVFEGIGDAEGTAIARLYPYDAYPILFVAKTADEARARADKWRTEAADRNEASFQARKAALEKARARKKKGKSDAD